MPMAGDDRERPEMTEPASSGGEGADDGTSVRRAVPDDLPRIREIVDAAYSPYVARMGTRPGPMLDDYAARIRDGEASVLVAQGGVAGVLVLVLEPDALLLDNVAVAPEAHGRGYGRRLVAVAEAEAVRRGRRTLRLYTHETMVENVALYARLGFVETGRGVQNGFRRIFMEKTL